VKRQNFYSHAISPRLYARIPKSVLAAIVVSIYHNLGDGMDYSDGVPLEKIDEAILKEWGLLHTQEIVPQKPPR
jgi:hypothetical protein